VCAVYLVEQVQFTAPSERFFLTSTPIDVFLHFTQSIWRKAQVTGL
jgi:hypothetical protein